MTLEWYDWLGLGGVAAILLSQLLLQIGVWRGDRAWFLIVNLLGALCTIFSLVWTLNLTGFIALPILWALISGLGLFLKLRRRSRAGELPATEPAKPPSQVARPPL